VTRAAVDVSALPTFAFGHRSLLWWATLGMLAIEGTGFAIVCAAYVYLKWRVPNWPPAVAPPDLFWGTATTVLLLVSAVPNELTKRAAEKLDLRGVRIWISVSLVLAVGFIILRALEFTTLNVWWDTNAYGSVVWTLLGLHTVHIVTDIIDTAVLTAVVFTRPLDGNRFVDVSENAFYFYFILVAWLPIYAVLYFAPRAF
jgi:heme/copper-type cytochrome/quinol oxidase subunit 3